MATSVEQPSLNSVPPDRLWLFFGLPVRFEAPISDLAGGLFVEIMRFCTP
nr:MAG TPA: hypothetical protein [Caudoviricetes sp.]